LSRIRRHTSADRVLDDERLVVFELGAASEDLSQRNENERDKNERAIDVKPSRDGKAAARHQAAPNSD
jgi:hypothetical protein